MISLFEQDACLHGGNGSSLAHILRSILPDLEAVRGHLAEILKDANDPLLRNIVEYLLESPGKQMRPALVLLSARAANGTGNGSLGVKHACLNVAAAVELIHMASLVHDDLIDDATVRHHRPSIQAKWGKRVSVSVGDHLCAKAFRLVADCSDPRLFAIVGSQLCAMCEGELLQVVERGDFNLSAHRCVAVMEKKTAALFAACCGAGAATVVREAEVCEALQRFGFHFGVAFQILDDCRDLLSDQERLGKTPGQDLLAGDVTLPLLYAIRYSWWRGEKPLDLCRHALGERELARLGEAFHSSPAPRRIAQLVASHIGRAKQQLQSIADSDFKASLRQLADRIAACACDVLER